MKGIELPVNIIIVIILAVIVLMVATYLIFTSSQTSGQGITRESIFRTLCQKWITINCDSSRISSISVTVSGKTYKFEDFNDICEINKPSTCSARCGC